MVKIIKIIIVNPECVSGVTSEDLGHLAAKVKQTLCSTRDHYYDSPSDHNVPNSRLGCPLTFPLFIRS